MEIAVVLDENERTACLEKNSFLRIYKKTKDGWIGGDKIIFDIKEGQGESNLYGFVTQIVDHLRACRLLVVKNISSPYLAILEDNLFHVWEMEGNPLDYLDYVYDSHSQEQKKKNLQKKLIAPTQTEEGDYYINLLDIMNDKSPLTSKQVLIPFFRERKFKRLIVDCDHFPRWFDAELPKSNFKVEICEKKDGIRVIVRNEEYGEDIAPT